MYHKRGFVTLNDRYSWSTWWCNWNLPTSLKQIFEVYMIIWGSSSKEIPLNKYAVVCFFHTNIFNVSKHYTSWSQKVYDIHYIGTQFP